jgi:hypothetical protein
MVLRLCVPIASAGPAACIISLLGLVGAVAWISWRFGPTLARVGGWCSFVVAWACGSQGGYGYCVAFAVFGALAWGLGTVWYARRRGRWPSALSARLFGDRIQLRPIQLPRDPYRSPSSPLKPTTLLS